jgi:outer membrane protein assembly factor BamB
VCATAAVARGVPPPPPATPAVAYQLNAAHTGVTADTVAARPKKQWSVRFTGGISYPLIVGGVVYVTVANTGSGSKLYALNATTGATAWAADLGGPYGWSGLAYAAGRIFTVNSNGAMEGFDATSGALDWVTQLPGQYLFSSPPTAAGGYVYTAGAGSGGTVYAVGQSTGAVAWTGSVQNGDDSSPAVSASGVYVSYACGQSYDFDPLTGALIWWRQTGCAGGGGKTPVLANGRLYVRDFSFPAVLDAGTGSLLAPFSSSGPAPAVDSGRQYDLNGSTLTAASLSSGTDVWSFSGDGKLSSAPLIADGTVFIGASSGELYALSSSTGKVTWSTNVGSSIAAPDEQNLGQPLTGLAASGGLLVVPAGQTLVAYR